MNDSKQCDVIIPGTVKESINVYSSTQQNAQQVFNRPILYMKCRKMPIEEVLVIKTAHFLHSAVNSRMIPIYLNSKWEPSFWKWIIQALTWLMTHIMNKLWHFFKKKKCRFARTLLTKWIQTGSTGELYQQKSTSSPHKLITIFVLSISDCYSTVGANHVLWTERVYFQTIMTPGDFTD